LQGFHPSWGFRSFRTLRVEIVSTYRTADRVAGGAKSGEVPVDRAPGRIGFKMSTQRRASQRTAATEIDRCGFWRLTAPLMSIIWLAWAWLLSSDGSSGKAVDRVATDSLRSDYHDETLARSDSRPGSPPPGATRTTGICHRESRVGADVRWLSLLRDTHRSSFRRVSLLPVRTHLRPTLPIAPAGQDRWAERHDGKRDLYFQHAA
jgi:hypothetical protein